MVVGEIISGVSSFLGGERANATNLQIARETSAFNAAEAEKSRDWQERMSSTAYGRAVRDMQSAGINPMLAYMKGGAATPGGATASGVSTSVEDSLGKAVHSAMDARRLKNELESTEADISLKKAQEAAMEATKERERTQATLNRAQAGMVSAETPAVAAEAGVRKGQAEISSKPWVQGADAILKRVLPTAGLATAAGGVFKLLGGIFGKGAAPTIRLPSGSRNIE